MNKIKWFFKFELKRRLHSESYTERVCRLSDRVMRSEPNEEIRRMRLEIYLETLERINEPRWAKWEKEQRKKYSLEGVRVGKKKG